MSKEFRWIVVALLVAGVGYYAATKIVETFIPTRRPDWPTRSATRRLPWSAQVSPAARSFTSHGHGRMGLPIVIGLQ
jgi:hypothetical protein